MKENVEKYKRLLSKVVEEIKINLYEYLKIYDYDNPKDDVQILELNSEIDLENAFYGAGFYIILTDHNFEINKCKFEYKGMKAIYRGHSYFTKIRLLSHLANSKYNLQRKEKKYSTNYKVCLKIEDNVNGINIDQEPYNKWKWFVIIHKMKGSTKLIREQAEKAFDKKYEKPIKSKENT